MSKSLKIKSKVSFVASYKGGTTISGTGRITDIVDGARGVWYVVKAEDGAVRKLRAANLTVL